MLGAIIGDYVGSRFEFRNTKTKDFELFHKDCMFTDDTVLTIAIAEIMQKGYGYDKDKIIDTIKKWARSYKYAGYGGTFFSWMLGDDRSAYYSCGNGAAMRVSACGWYGRTESEVTTLATKVTEVTHNHPEGIKGAVVTAMAVFYARTGKTKDFIRSYLIKEYPEIEHFSYNDLLLNYGDDLEICQKTVPQAMYCFLISNSFEDCLRTTISIGGDTDTTSAISCAVAEAYYGIPSGLSIKIKNILYKNKDSELMEIVNNYEKYKSKL